MTRARRGRASRYWPPALVLVVLSAGAFWYGARLIVTITGFAISGRERVQLVTDVRREVRRTAVVLMENWLAPSQFVGRRLRATDLVDRVRTAEADLDALAPISPQDVVLRRELERSLAFWSNYIFRVDRGWDASISVVELQGYIDDVDRVVDRMIHVISEGSDPARGRLADLGFRAKFAQMLSAAAAVTALLLLAMWRASVRAELQLARAEDARDNAVHAAQQRSQFFSNTSHELRTPLVAIRGFATMIAGNPSAGEDVRQASEKIEREAQELLAHINNILDAAKLEAAGMELTFERVDLGQVLRRCARRCEGLVGDKAIEVTTEIASGLSPIRGDVVKLQQVFTNLLANAIKFTERGSVRVRVSERDATLVVEVTDTGIGIPSEALETIWKPFSQADGTTSRRFGGTGLGLSIVRGIVDLHGGQVTVESSVGTGTTFTVVLPRAAAEAAPTSDAVPAA